MTMKEFWAWLFSRSAAAVGAFFAAIIGLGFLIRALVGLSEPSLISLALLGVMALLGSLLIFTTLMNALGLSDRRQALGLPDGSVRALLALALLGLFAVLAAAVLVRPAPWSSDNLSQADAAQIVAANPRVDNIVTVAGTAPGTFKVVIQRPAPYDDFSKQILTLVGTLMTAVISFYFGSSTVPAAPRTGAGAFPTPVPARLMPADGRAGAERPYVITGSNLAGVTRVEFVPAAGDPVAARSVSAGATSVTAVVTLMPKWLNRPCVTVTSTTAIVCFLNPQLAALSM